MTDLKRVIAYSTMSQIGYMIMAVSLVRLHGGPVPPDDARVLQGAAVHGGRLGDRRDGGRAEPRQDGRLPQARCRSRSDDARRRRSRSRASRRCRATSPRTRSSRYVTARDDWHIVLAVIGFIGSFLTAVYTFRMIFRAFYGEPVEQARELEHGPPLPRARAHEPGDGRGRGHRRRLPRPGPPHRRARVADEGRDGRCSRSARSSSASLQIPDVTHVLDSFLRAGVRRTPPTSRRSSRATELT